MTWQAGPNDFLSREAVRSQSRANGLATAGRGSPEAAFFDGTAAGGDMSLAARTAGRAAATTFGAAGVTPSEPNRAETAHDEPMIGSGPRIRISQRMRLTSR